MFEKRLVVEVDGGQHGEEAIARRDEERTTWLNGKGYRLVRFRNNDIPGDLEGVLESIVEDSPAESGSPAWGRRHTLHPIPLPSRERVILDPPCNRLAPRCFLSTRRVKELPFPA